jgi:hypothetical protein
VSLDELYRTMLTIRRFVDGLNRRCAVEARGGAVIARIEQ